MKITDDMRKCTAERAISEAEALQLRMNGKSKGFVVKCAAVYATA